MLRYCYGKFASNLTGQARLLSGKNLTAQWTIPMASMETAASTKESPKFNIQHDSKKQKFFVQFDSDTEAFINYERLNNNEVLLYHTEVPESFRNTGIAKIMATEVLNHFKNSNQKMQITCTYLQKINNSLEGN